MLMQSFQTANILSGPDLLVVVGIAALLFGGKKIPETFEHGFFREILQPYAEVSLI